MPATTTTETLRIGVNPWPGYLFLHLAEERGLFEKHGVTVQLVELASSGDVALAYQRNQIDIATSTTVDLMTTAHLTDKRPQVFAICDFSNGADVILARPEIAAVNDLRGKRVAAESGTLDMVHLILALQTAGMSLQDITHVPMSQASMPDAWDNGNIDAAVTYPPNSMAISNNGGQRLFDTSHIPGTIVDVLMAEQDLIDTRHKELQAVVTAMQEAVELWAADPTNSLATMAKRGGVSSEALAADLKGLSIPTLDDQLALLHNSDTLKQSILATLSALNLPPTLATGEWFNPRIIAAVQQPSSEQ